MLEENAAFLTNEQLDQHVARLNKKGFQSLDAEWEVAVLNACSKIGILEHEPSLDGTAKLDVLFTTEDGFSFLADITTVSDEGLEEQEPVKAFGIELVRQLRRAGLPVDGWTLNIGTHPAKYGERTKPAIPARNEFATEVFNARFKAYIKAVQDHPQERRTYSVSTRKTAIALTYTPNGRFFTTIGPSFGTPLKKDQNAIFYALRAKARQLKRVAFQGPRGIILCDGGTDRVHTRSHSGFDFIQQAADPTKEFLRQNQSIDFVLLVTSVGTDAGRYALSDSPYVRKVKVTIFANKDFQRLPPQIRGSLHQLESFFPEPANTPAGARETIRRGFNPKQLRPLRGGWAVSDKEIKISASAVLGLLAEAVTPAELFKSLGFRPHSNKPTAFRNPFDYMLSRKMRLREIAVEDTPYDDSCLVFKFEGRDPALSEFTNPKG